MKLRLKHAGRRSVVDCEPSDTLADLCALALEHLHVSEGRFSLNGRDVLEGDDQTLSDLGIVSGDLVWVLGDSVTTEQNQNPVQNLPLASQAQPSLKLSSEQSTLPLSSTSHNEGASSSSSKSSSDTTGGAASASVEPAHEGMDTDAIQDSEVNLYLREPGLVRESTDSQVPQTLTITYQSGAVRNASEAVCVVLHVLMCESGYCPRDSSGNSTSSQITSYELSEGWRQVGCFRLWYSHPRCTGFTFLLNCVPVGPVMIIHGRAESADRYEPTTSQLQIKPSEYVNTGINFTGSPDVTSVYRNLSKLSRIFKDGVTHHMLTSCLQEQGQIEVTTLEGLITELKMQILQYLSAADLLRVAETCQELSNLALNSQQLWRQRYLRDFGRRQDNSINQNWKAMYRNKYTERKRMQAHYRFLMNPDPGPYGSGPQYPHPFNPTYPPGFIGGDYDRDPLFPGMGGPFRPGARPMMPRPRFDPMGPLPNQRFRPGRGGGLWDGRGSGFGPRFF